MSILYSHNAFVRQRGITNINQDKYPCFLENTLIKIIYILLEILGVDEQLSGNYATFMHACYLIYTIDELSPRLLVSIFQHNIMIR